MFFETGGTRLAYTDSGDGAPVVFLHGWGSGKDAFRGILAHLSGRGFRLVAPDFPGCGESALPERPLTLADYADMVRALIDHLGLGNPVLCGHSHGGRVALYLAGKGILRPEKMILFGAAGMKPKRSPAKRLRQVGFKAAKRVLTLPPFRARYPGAVEKLRVRFGSADYAAAPPVMRQTLVGLVNSDIRDLFPAVSASTLLIWGENDTETPLYMARYMEKTIPDCGLCVIPGTGHWVFAERPGAVYPILDRFLGVTG